ncbi:MAG: KGGVGR-motif variant AAA ATPase [Nostoc sp. ChiSLP01]|nr:AAA family ATPase [Nostoc sp. CmiSLP01]MDZ8284667.1 AAA family ATPase [Nostoc sp. ChiSLP01]
MKTITFYSYKGGVGRTLAAANFALYLAKLGRKTVVVDFDLEAPGLDAKFAKFSGLELPVDQKGLLDYILDYQRQNTDPGRIEQISLQIPIPSKKTSPLWLIPAGQYLSDEYYRNLSELDWNLLFSKERDGVAFFQQFLARIEKELQAEFVIIDSRTGITEIAGICTQQLPDEVVMLSPLSSESIKVSKHIKQLIEQSAIAKTLGKSIDVKVVVSRVPKPKKDLDSFKQKCCNIFEIDETKLFFLFSCENLEEEEFLAIAVPESNKELVSNYVRLFYGLNLKLSSENIRAEIEQIGSRLLFSSSVEKSEEDVLELVALYPYPDVYRAAMRFFRLRKNTEKLRSFGWELLDLLPTDEEAQQILAESYLSERKLDKQDKNKAVPVIDSLWQREKLNSEQSVRYADILEDLEEYSKSFDVVFPLCEDQELDDHIQIQAKLIAARTALKLGQTEIAARLIPDIPPKQLGSSLIFLAIETLKDNGDLEGAFESAKQFIRREYNSTLVEQAARLAHQLNRIKELEDAIRSLAKQRISKDESFYQNLKDCGLFELARELQKSSY